MEYITAKEIAKLEAAGVKVVLGEHVRDEAGERYLMFSPAITDSPTLAVVVDVTHRLYAEFSNKVIARADGVGYLVYIRRNCTASYSARLGSFSDYGNRWFAGLHRRWALRKAMRALGV